MNNQPFISVIVPVYNGGKFLHQCLDALFASEYPAFEVIVVDDGSTDDSAQISKEKGATVLTMPRQSGPGAARNHGAEKGQSDILLFVDADVVVKRDTLAKVAADFQQHADFAALFGSYDDEPREKNFLSQYKNLCHHFVHQQSSSEAFTFWAGLGAVKRKEFLSVGGFDEKQFPIPSIEDIELGARFRRAGHRILLDKELQATHLKRWELWSWLRTDIFCRAIPWSRLLLTSKQLVNDLNLKTSDRVSAMLVGLSVGLLPFTLLNIYLLFVILFFLFVILLLNHKLFRFFFQRKGILFAALAFPCQLLYYFYSGTTFVLCWFRYALPRTLDFRRGEN